MDIQIVPNFINQPKPGSKWGSVKANDGNYYSVSPALLPSFSKGVPIMVQVEAVNKGDKVYYNIRGVDLAGGQTALPNNIPASQQLHAPSAVQRNGNGDTKSREMFIMGCVGRAMGSGSFTANDIKLLTLAAAEAWDELGRRDSSDLPI